jgi:hypothetical protein
VEESPLFSGADARVAGSSGKAVPKMLGIVRWDPGRGPSVLDDYGLWV